MESRLVKLSLDASAESGVVTAFVVGLLMTFVVCAGLGVDGGRLIAARLEMADLAENAARIGAQELFDFRSGEPKLDHSKSRYSVYEFLSDEAVTADQADVVISDLQVAVTVQREIEMTLLKLFGVQSHELKVTRVAEPRDN